MTEAARIPTLSTLEGLSYGFWQMLPNYLGGLFTPNRFWFGFWSTVHPDPAAVKRIGELREKYQSDYFYLKLLGKKSLLVLDLEGIRQVLDQSPDVFAEPGIKKKGMSYFQPNALTISRGKDWQERRSFNEAVLASGQEVHPHGDQFLKIIFRETTRLHQEARQQLVWADFATLFQRITVKILFGSDLEETTLLEQLKDLMQTSNRGFALKKSSAFDDFYRELRTQLKAARPSSLAELCQQVPATENTRVENQVPHWMFAMADTLAINSARADTLAINSARTLALIVSHPEAKQAVAAEMKRVDLPSPGGINQLKYLEGCVQEAMRLWPTTPLLVRETLQPTLLGGETIPPGTQVLILNSFNHRDRKKHSFADRFAPEIWQETRSDYNFNHLSNGKQGCAGKDLALFIAKAVLAGMLKDNQYQLVGPELAPEKPLPYRYNHFQLEFATQTN